MLQSWVPNTLPLPYPMMLPMGREQAQVMQENGAAREEGAAQVQSPPAAVIKPVFVDIDDNFTKGQVVKYFPHQGHGLILDKNGRELYFKLTELDFIGEKKKESLKAGVPVGFDVSITSRGLHVKKLKIY